MNGPSTNTQATALESSATKPRIPVLANKRTNSWPKHQQGRPAQYTSLAEAFEQTYPTDAHFAAYSVPSVTRRLATVQAIVALADKGGIPMPLFVSDIDAPNHQATDAWFQAEMRKLDALKHTRRRAHIHFLTAQRSA